MNPFLRVLYSEFESLRGEDYFFHTITVTLLWIDFAMHLKKGEGAGGGCHEI